jgi:DNA-binding NarL/FixJ family response regulator
MRIVIVDDHPLIQAAVSHIVRRIDPQGEIAAAGDCESGLELAERGPEPDLALLDLNLPGRSGIPALKLWRSRLPAVPVVVLSAVDDHATVLATMDAGAAGFIPKSSTNEIIETAVRLVLAGGKYFPAEVLVRRSVATLFAPQRIASASTASLDLTERQMQVLRMIACGASNKVICRELGLAERTVKAHVTAVFRALNVASRTQAALAAARLGMAPAAPTPCRAPAAPGGRQR